MSILAGMSEESKDTRDQGGWIGENRGTMVGLVDSKHWISLRWKWLECSENDNAIAYIF